MILVVKVKKFRAEYSLNCPSALTNLLERLMNSHRNSCQRQKQHGDGSDGFHRFAVILEDVTIMLSNDVERLRDR